MAHLEDWEIEVDRQGVEKLSIGMTDNPFSDSISTNFGFSFTNRSHGGCSRATVNLMGQSAAYVAGLDLLPDDRLTIRLQCGAESSLIDRYVGALKQVDMGWGTEPKVRKLQAAGIFGQFRKIPVLLFYDNYTIKQVVQGVIGDLAGKSDITSTTTHITYGDDYTIELTDFMDVYGDRALKRLATLAGPSCVWGVVPGAGGTPTDAYFYFKELGDTPATHTFEVGNNIEDAEGTYSRQRFLNGMLVSCQRKIGGGDLWMYVPPPDGTIPFRVGKQRVPEVVEPTDAYHFAQVVVGGFPENDEQIKFTVPDFGEQVWANEIMNTPLSIKLQNGGAAHEVMVQEYTTSVDETGSVETDFVLGTMPDLHLQNTFGDLMRDQVVSEAREFWSGAELAARDSDVIRTWRRHAAKTHDIRNFWGTNLDNIESAMTDDDWNDGGFEVPTGFPEFGWDYDSDKQRIGGSGARGTVVSIPIPTGLTAGAAIVYIKTAGATYWQDDSEHWTTINNPAPNASYVWFSDWFGIRPKIYVAPSNAWRCGCTLAYTFSSGVPEQPIKLWVGPMMRLADTSAPADYDDMIALTNYVDIVFASSGTTPTTLNGYCLRLHRRSGDAAGDVSCALGWVSSGTFHSDWWDAGATPGSQAVGTIGLGTDAEGVVDAHSFELDVWLPTTGGSGTFRVRAREDQTADILWDSTSIHGDGEVSGSAPDPAGRYYVSYVWWEADPKDEGNQTNGPKAVEIRSPGGINVAVSRDGEFWTVGATQVLLTLFGDEYLAEKKQLVFSVNLGEGNSLGSWGVGFKHETPSVELTWDQNFGDYGTGDGEFVTPRDLTVDGDYIYVSDYANDRIQLLTNTDPPVYDSQFGTTGTGDDEFDTVWGIDQDDTYLYIADVLNDRVKVHLKAAPHTFIRSIENVGMTGNLRGVTVEGRTYSATDRVYACCEDGYVWIFQKDGTYLDKFEPFDEFDPPDNIPEDVCLSGDGDYLYIACPGGSASDDPSNCVRKFSKNSPYTQVWTWGIRGSNPATGKWEWPWSVCRLGDLLIVGAGSSGVYPAKVNLVILADRGTYAEYMDHVDGTGGESGAGLQQGYAGDIRDNILYVTEVGWSQIKRYILS